jgi:hypothetical protein
MGILTAILNVLSLVKQLLDFVTQHVAEYKKTKERTAIVELEKTTTDNIKNADIKKINDELMN